MGLAACGSSVEHRACMTVGTSDPLVTGAQLFRLDIYGANVACAGDTVASGAGGPLISRTYAKGQAIAVDVPPGLHTLALTTYADAAGTAVLGRGCTQTTLTPGAQICFDLSLMAASPLDLSAVASADLAGTTACNVASECGPDGGAGEGCCSHVCTDVGESPAHCGGCNMSCSTSHITPACAGGDCTGTCDTGWGDCNGDKRSDGCETSIATITNCSGCGLKCDTTFSNGAGCSGTTCNYTSCKTGRIDCNTTAPDGDGCECATASTAGQGTAGCCGDGTQCQTKHDNGTGQNFYNCTALGTHDDASALAACAAKTGDATKCYWFPCKFTVDSVYCDNSSPSATMCNCWEEAGSGMGTSAGNPGHVSTNCSCYHPGDSPWN
jgi:hypothetical protein